MPYDQKAMELQRAEFDAADRLAEQLRRHSMTMVVDDDYPEVRHNYENALADFIKAMVDNGRFEPGNRYRLYPPKGVKADAAIAIGEDAFRAGYRSAAERARAFHPAMIEDGSAHENAAWGKYEPPEHIKDLTR